VWDTTFFFDWHLIGYLIPTNLSQANGPRIKQGGPVQIPNGQAYMVNAFYAERSGKAGRLLGQYGA
jgi:hypothetical protein